MSKKIKEIKIEAFRAYEKLQTFDFRHNNSENIADLVVIYAPNGYGKTSFFDAIEWAITDEIARLKSTEAIKQEVKSERGDILKNRNSNLLQGIVQIITETDNVFEKRTKKRIGNMKSDYRAGDLEPISRELQGILEEKNTFCTTNMLAHDKITSFLQTYTAEDKTEALQIFWDTEGYSKILKVINNLYDEITKQEKSLSLEIVKDGKELKLYKYESSKENELKQLIDSYNLKNTKYNINSDKLIENIDSIIERVSSILKVTRENKLKNEEEISTVELLIIEFPDFILRKKELKKKANLKEQYEKKLLIISNIDILDIKKNQLKNEQMQYDKIISNWDKFKIIEESITKNNNVRKQTLDLKFEVQRSIIKNKENIGVYSDNVSKNKKLLNTKIERRKFVENELNKYYNNISSLNKYHRLYDKASWLLSKRIDKRKELSDEINNIESFFDNKCSIDNIKDYLTDEILSDYEKLLILISDDQNQKKKIAELEIRHKNAMLLCDKINQLVTQGKELVENSQSHECPLCHAQYEDFTSLIESISMGYNSSLELDDIKSLLMEEKKINAQTLENIDIDNEKFRKSVNIILLKIKESYNRNNNRIQNLQMKLNDWYNLMGDKQNDNNELKVKYKSENVDIQDANVVKIFKAAMDKSNTELSKVIEADEVKLSSAMDLVKNEEINLKSYELKLLEIEENLLLIKNNEIYMNSLTFLKNKFLWSEGNNLQNILIQIDNQKSNISKEITDIEVEIASLQKNVQEKKEEIDFNYKSILIKIQELTSNIEGYRLRCRKLFANAEVEDHEIESSITNKKNDFLNIKSTIDENIFLLDSITTSVKNVQVQKIWLNKKREFERKNVKWENIKAKLENLKTSKTFVEEYIVQQTNSYFNSDAINQIYHKIDPHPTMNHIKFVTENSIKGLQTHIYTFDKTEDDKMSPVLYLSSAQVNILSLCIFLAKVLTERGTTLNTIFMDDPIQHLDGINLLAFIDLLRTITTTMGRQIIISTHNEHFYNLIKVKMDNEYYPSKFIELNSVGEIKRL